MILPIFFCVINGTNTYVGPWMIVAGAVAGTWIGSGLTTYLADRSDYYGLLDKIDERKAKDEQLRSSTCC
jgi:uncharacterized membrane protein